jgi:hypothetical protein
MRVSQAELNAIDNLISYRLEALSFDRQGKEYQFLKHLNRKVKRNIKTHVISYEIKKQIVFVKA